MTSTKPRRTFRLCSLLVVLALVGGCGGKSESQKTYETLTAALNAHKAGDLVEARKGYDEVLKHDAHNVYALFNIGVIEQAEAHPAQAESYYRLAIAADPNFVQALFNLAIIRTGAGDKHEAQTLYERVIALQPEHASAHLNLGFLLLEDGKKASAKREFDVATGLDPALASRIPKKDAATPSP